MASARHARMVEIRDSRGGKHGACRGRIGCGAPGRRLILAAFGKMVVKPRHRGQLHAGCDSYKRGVMPENGRILIDDLEGTPYAARTPGPAMPVTGEREEWLARYNVSPTP